MSGDRCAGPIRVARAELFDLNQQRIAVVTLISDARLPEVVMFNGEPFLRVKRADVLAYDQARAYRADAMVIEDLRT